MSYTIEFAPIALEHLRAFRKRDQQIIFNAISLQLANEPDVPTPHRKPLAENPIAPWELRVGDFRVFYDIQGDAVLVLILAIGHKTHNRLRIGGMEIDL